MMPNVFTISAKMGAEDRFTAHWHYLLDNHPTLGQQVVDTIADSAGLPRSRFLKAEDHPAFTQQDQPDFLMLCEDYGLLCEHKLDSPLGERQLERYCALSRDGLDLKVVLITNDNSTVVPPTALSHPGYLRPVSGLRPFFMWEDFYHLVEATEGRLAREFAQYMGSLGMEHWTSTGEWGDPFADPDSASRFKELYNRVKPLFDRKGCRRVVDSVSLGMAVSYPTEDIHLLYLLADKPGRRHLEHPISGRAFYIQIFSQVDEPCQQSLPALEGWIDVDGISVHVVTAEEPRPAPEVGTPYRLLREYAIALPDLLQEPIEAPEQRMGSFIQVVLEHLQRRV